MATRFLPVFPDLEELMEELSDEERGQLLRAMMGYFFRGEEDKPQGNARFIWPSVRRTLDQCIAKAERNRLNGEKGGRPRRQAVPADSSEEDDARAEAFAHEAAARDVSVAQAVPAAGSEEDDARAEAFAHEAAARDMPAAGFEEDAAKAKQTDANQYQEQEQSQEQEQEHAQEQSQEQEECAARATAAAATTAAQWRPRAQKTDERQASSELGAGPARSESGAGTARAAATAAQWRPRAQRMDERQAPSEPGAGPARSELGAGPARLAAQYRLPESATSTRALAQDIEAYGEATVEAALREAEASNSRPMLSVNFYRAVLRGVLAKAGGQSPFPARNGRSGEHSSAREASASMLRYSPEERRRTYSAAVVDLDADIDDAACAKAPRASSLVGNGSGTAAAAVVDLDANIDEAACAKAPRAGSTGGIGSGTAAAAVVDLDADIDDDACAQAPRAGSSGGIGSGTAAAAVVDLDGDG